MRCKFALSIVSLALFGIAPLSVPAAARAAPEAKVAAPTLQAVLADPRRDKDRARDAFRHPAETLAFARIAPGMTVADYLPGDGWYTRAVVPFLGEMGHYIALFRAPRPDQVDPVTTFPAKATGWTGAPADRIAAYGTAAIPAAANGTVDRVLLMREMHNMLANGWLYGDLKAIRALLKPDGLLVIEQHRAKADASADYTDGSMGYLRQKDVVALVETMGFELVDTSEANANPKDPANWPDGVWTLPPAYTLKDKDRDRYAAIGESDRMTLLFRKRP